MGELTPNDILLLMDVVRGLARLLNALGVSEEEKVELIANMEVQLSKTSNPANQKFVDELRGILNGE